MIIIFECHDQFGSETFYSIIFFSIATAAIAKIPLYYKNMTFEDYCEMSLEGYTFYNVNI